MRKITILNIFFLLLFGILMYLGTTSENVDLLAAGLFIPPALYFITLFLQKKGLVKLLQDAPEEKQKSAKFRSEVAKSIDDHMSAILRIHLGAGIFILYHLAYRLLIDDVQQFSLAEAGLYTGGIIVLITTGILFLGSTKERFDAYGYSIVMTLSRFSPARGITVTNKEELRQSLIYTSILLLIIMTYPILLASIGYLLFGN